MDRKPPPKPKRLENGAEIFNFEVQVDSRLLPRPQRPKRTGTEQNAESPDDLENEAPGAVTDAGGDALVRVPCRVLSDGYTWSSTWWGPQLIHNGYDGAKALKSLSKTLNTGRTRPVNFTWEHTNALSSKAGHMENWSWEKENGDIPAGLNAEIVVDPECDAKAALWLDRGYINATSVSWHPDMKKSHPDMDIEDFLDRMGEEENGEVICWRVIGCDAENVFHHAAVWAGADPYSGPRGQENGSVPASVPGANTNGGQGRPRHYEAENAATAASDTNGGGRSMDKIEQLVAMLSATCTALGFEVMMNATDIPPDLQERIVNGIGEARKGLKAYNDMAQRLQTIGNSVLKEGETSLKAGEVLDRIPERIEMAKHGEAFLEAQRKEALRLFDMVHVDPANPENMSALHKRKRQRIEQCTNLQELGDSIEENSAEAKKRFGPHVSMRSTSGEEDIPQPQGTATTLSVDQEQIRDGATDIFGKKPKK